MEEGVLVVEVEADPHITLVDGGGSDEVLQPAHQAFKILRGAARVEMDAEHQVCLLGSWIQGKARLHCVHCRFPTFLSS